MCRSEQRQRQLKRVIAFALVIAFLGQSFTVLPSQATPLNAPALQDGSKGRPTVDPASLQPAQSVLLDKNNADTLVSAAGADALVETYIVVLDDAALASYRGGVAGLAATSPAVLGQRKLNARSTESLAYLGHLEQQQADSITRAERTLGRSLNVLYQYRATVNGFAAKMTAAEAVALAKLPGIRFVEKERIYELHTDAGPAWSGAGDVWAGNLGITGTRGEGIVVGVIDTGIDPWNPSFAATGGDGYTHVNPLGDGVYVGVCNPANTAPPPGVLPYDPTFPCNAKLIGAWGYSSIPGSPRDGDGHGSHTASTAAGNVVNEPDVVTPTGTYTVAQISGVAPHANIIAYAACCTGAALQAARDQALLDGVDVINYSIGALSPTPDPYNDVEAISWLALRDAGVFVATSAGNSGPGASTVGSPADLPWLTVVGANSHNRAFLSTLSLSDGANSPLELTGLALAAGYGPAPIVFASDFVVAPTTAENARLCAPGAFPPGTFNGEIVICERGVYGRVAKGQSAKDGGAGGMILAQPVEFTGGPGSLVADTHVLPAVHIDYYTYQQLLAYFAAAAGPVTGSLSGGVESYPAGYEDVMAEFSSRGPNLGLFRDLIVPSVTAPGRSILAAYHQGAADGEYTYNVIGGTSMSSPHVAGAGALLKALHPEWTPAEIQSALMTTARTNVRNDDGVTPATPFAQGSGHINIAQAARAGLVLDVTTADYLAANPANGGEHSELNLASVAESQCLLVCRWTRTVRSTLAVAESWTVGATTSTGMIITAEPSQFTLEPGATQVITITTDASAAALNQWIFGEIQLTPAGDTPPAHLPLAVSATASLFPDSVTIPTRRNAGSHLVTGLQAIEITDLTITPYGLATGEAANLALSQDPTNGDPYDNINDGTVSVTLVEVPANSLRLFASILESSAFDLDLFVGTGSVPSAATEVCYSASPTSIESCVVDHPAAGTWWILVQNWQASDTPPDFVSLAYGLVAGDNGNLWAEGPTSVPAGTAFDLRVYWDVPALEAGQVLYGALALGTDPANPGNLGMIFVDLERYPDDVVKFSDFPVAAPGDTVAYEIFIRPNVTPEDLTYTITDVLPAGLTYVPDSLVASTGQASVEGNTITWTGVLTSPTNFEGSYLITSNETDPFCYMPTGPGYFDLETNVGIGTDPSIAGDTIAFGYNGFANTDFYGIARATPPLFTDDGIVVFGEYAGEPWVNQSLPNPAVPNGLLAPYWRDMEIVHDAATNRGVTAASIPGEFWIVEFDDIQAYGDPTKTLDFQVLSWYYSVPAPGVYDAYFAFDNVNMGDTIGTIGVENDDGTQATQFSFNDFTPTNGLVLCLDYVGLQEVTINFDVTVDAAAPAGIVVNEVVHNTDNPGSKPAATGEAMEIVRTDVLFLSLSGSDRIGGVSARDEDILAYDTLTGTWSKYFDGSDVGLADNDIGDFHIADNGDIYLTFAKSQNMRRERRYEGPNRIDEHNIYRFIPTSLGERTAGRFELYFDGSDVGLTTSGEDIDALYVYPSEFGQLIALSTRGSYRVPGFEGEILRGKDEDILFFAASSLGEDTAGEWFVGWYGADEGLTRSSEDVRALWFNHRSEILLSTAGKFSVAGLEGDGRDIVKCTFTDAIEPPYCSFSLVFDGSEYDLDKSIDGFVFGSLPITDASMTMVDAEDTYDESQPELNDHLEDDILDEDEIFDESEGGSQGPVHLPMVGN